MADSALKVEIAHARPEDRPAIARLVRTELGYSSLDEERLYARIARMEADANYSLHVAKASGRVVGFIACSRGIALERDGDYLRILALAVDRTVQHRGVGSELLKEAERRAYSFAASAIVVSSGAQRSDAHEFYQKRGFEKRGFSFTRKL